jgi:hypothetical protein
VLPDPFPHVAVEFYFLYARRRRRLHSSQVSSTLSVEHDDYEPLDRDRSVAYRFGEVK